MKSKSLALHRSVQLKKLQALYDAKPLCTSRMIVEHVHMMVWNAGVQMPRVRDILVWAPREGPYRSITLYGN